MLRDVTPVLTYITLSKTVVYQSEGTLYEPNGYKYPFLRSQHAVQIKFHKKLSEPVFPCLRTLKSRDSH